MRRLATIIFKCFTLALSLWLLAKPFYNSDAQVRVIDETPLPIKPPATRKPTSRRPVNSPSHKPTTKPVTHKPTSSVPSERIGPNIEIEMVSLPGKEGFMMGSPKSDSDREDDEELHPVTVPAFSIGKYEITQAQWGALMGSNPSRNRGANLPVERVSWKEAQEFCQKLSRLKKKKFRLPTEAEWEYACSVSTEGAYPNELKDIAWYKENSSGQTRPVGQKKAMKYELFDMLGNVSEWCEDVYHSNYKEVPNDGSAWSNAGDSERQVVRGGSWDDPSFIIRPTRRNSYPPAERNNGLGFRVVESGKMP